ncbi:MAG TPA: acyl-CoA reductase [Thermoleophilaceae bacterium]|nr:acyl-CoA reductase [Thermoleophilaceae bacterium]
MSTSATTAVQVPAVVRGEVITDDLTAFATRGGEQEFYVPDPARLAGRLPLADAGSLRELTELSFDDIVDYLAELGSRLVPDHNDHLQEAIACSSVWSDATPPLVEASYRELQRVFEPALVREMAELAIGIEHLEGWPEVTFADGRTAAVHAMGARVVHIIAGNSPAIAALTIVRNAITRSDAIIKSPSNDPLTAAAIARTMVDMDPAHPLTGHLAVAYWKGGDEAFEERLYRPEHVEKIVAWGGLAGVRHVTRYIQPGLELITLDPKRSATIIGPEAFADEQTLRAVATRTAADVGTGNQLYCVNARVIFVVTGTDPEGIERAERLGALLYDEVQALPPSRSTPAKRFDPALRAEIDALRVGSDWYRVIGGEHDEGAVIVSTLDEPVDFYPSLGGRVANIVPVESLDDILPHINAYTQTVGIYPEALKKQLREVLPFYGAQRLVSLGGAARFASPGLPQDGIEPLRRSVKWIVEESG